MVTGFADYATYANTIWNTSQKDKNPDIPVNSGGNEFLANIGLPKDYVPMGFVYSMGERYAKGHDKLDLLKQLHLLASPDVPFNMTWDADRKSWVAYQVAPESQKTYGSMAEANQEIQRRMDEQGLTGTPHWKADYFEDDDGEFIRIFSSTDYKQEIDPKKPVSQTFDLGTGQVVHVLSNGQMLTVNKEKNIDWSETKFVDVGDEQWAVFPDGTKQQVSQERVYGKGDIDLIDQHRLGDGSSVAVFSNGQMISVDANKVGSVSRDESGYWRVTNPDGSIQLKDPIYQSGVAQEAGFNILQGPQGPIANLGLPEEPAQIETIGESQYIRSVDQNLSPLNQVLDRAMEQAILQGTPESIQRAIAYDDFRKRPSSLEALQAAMEWARTPGDQQMLSAIHHGYMDVSAPVSGDISRVADPAQFAQDAYAQFQESLTGGALPVGEDFRQALTTQAPPMTELEAAQLENAQLNNDLLRAQIAEANSSTTRKDNESIAKVESTRSNTQGATAISDAKVKTETAKGATYGQTDTQLGATVGDTGTGLETGADDFSGSMSPDASAANTLVQTSIGTISAEDHSNNTANTMKRFKVDLGTAMRLEGQNTSTWTTQQFKNAIHKLWAGGQDFHVKQGSGTLEDPFVRLDQNWRQMETGSSMQADFDELMGLVESGEWSGRSWYVSGKQRMAQLLQKLSPAMGGNTALISEKEKFRLLDLLGSKSETAGTNNPPTGRWSGDEAEEIEGGLTAESNKGAQEVQGGQDVSTATAAELLWEADPGGDDYLDLPTAAEQATTQAAQIAHREMRAKETALPVAEESPVFEMAGDDDFVPIPSAAEQVSALEAQAAHRAAAAGSFGTAVGGDVLGTGVPAQGTYGMDIPSGIHAPATERGYTQIPGPTGAEVASAVGGFFGGGDFETSGLQETFGRAASGIKSFFTQPTAVERKREREMYANEGAAGTLTDDRVTLVGESGPELAMFPNGTEIIPLDRQMKPEQARRLRRRGVRGMAEGGLVFDPGPLPVGVEQLQSGRAIGPSRGRLFRAAGLTTPSAQAVRNLLPEELDIFRDLGSRAGIPGATFERELALGIPSGQRQRGSARMLPLSLRT